MGFMLASDVAGASWAAASVRPVDNGGHARVTASGFSLLLPSGWNSVPLNGSDVTQLLNAATANDPSLTSALSAEVKQAASHHIKVFALGPARGSSVTDLNVVVEPAAGLPSGKAFATAAVPEAKQALAQIGASHLVATVARTPLGTAALVTYQLPLKSVGSVVGLQVYVLRASHLYIIAFSGPTLGGDRTVARSVERSWHWTASSPT
jgi:hypothetical protein